MAKQDKDFIHTANSTEDEVPSPATSGLPVERGPTRDAACALLIRTRTVKNSRRYITSIRQIKSLYFGEQI